MQKYKKIQTKHINTETRKKQKKLFLNIKLILLQVEFIKNKRKIVR